MKFIQAHWAIITVLAAGLIAWGALQARVSSVETEVSSIRNTMSTDHDAIIEIRTEQRLMKQQVDKMDSKIDKVLEAVK